MIEFTDEDGRLLYYYFTDLYEVRIDRYLAFKKAKEGKGTAAWVREVINNIKSDNPDLEQYDDSDDIVIDANLDFLDQEKDQIADFLRELRQELEIKPDTIEMANEEAKRLALLNCDLITLSKYLEDMNGIDREVAYGLAVDNLLKKSEWEKNNN